MEKRREGLASQSLVASVMQPRPQASREKREREQGMGEWENGRGEGEKGRRGKERVNIPIAEGKQDPSVRLKESSVLLLHVDVTA